MYKVYRPCTVFRRAQRAIRFPFESLRRVLLCSGFWAPPRGLVKWPHDISPGGHSLPLCYSPDWASLLTGVAGSAHRCGLAVPSGAISLNHFLASVRILCLSSVLKRETSSWIMSSHVEQWVRKIVSNSLIMPCGSSEYDGVCFCQYNMSIEENGL